MVRGVLDEVGVLDAAGVMGAGVRWLSVAGCGEGAGVFTTLGRILNATLDSWPRATVTLSSENPRLGCHARTRYRPGGMPSMLNVPFAAVCE